MKGDYPFGNDAGVALFYLFVMLLRADKNNLEVPRGLAACRDRIRQLPWVEKATGREGLT